jgi:hypothetical protein
MSIIPSGWLERRRERARSKAVRTGDSPEKLAELKRRGGPPDKEPGFVEKMFWLAPEGRLSRGQARRKLKHPRR